MTINHQNITINVFSSQNPMKRGITHALAVFCNNHIFAYLTLNITFRWSKTTVGQVDLTAKLCLSFYSELQSAKST